MGDKISARRAMIAAGVPVIPGEELSLENPDEMVDELVRAATRVGYPLLLKASAGGGGKGMRVVRELTSLSTTRISRIGRSKADYRMGVQSRWLHGALCRRKTRSWSNHFARDHTD